VPEWHEVRDLIGHTESEVEMHISARRVGLVTGVAATVALTAVLGWSSDVCAQDVAHGRSLYMTNCKTCHGRPENNFHDIVEDGGNNPDGLYKAWLANPSYMIEFASFPYEDAADIAAYLGTFLDTPPLPVVVEYYHAGFDHYFTTSSADEITKLDDGTIAGWARTGEQFNAYPRTDVDGGLTSVCRFFSTAFAPKSSHFYAPLGVECNAVKQNPNWSFEGETFIVEVPDDGGYGFCPPGTAPVYRLYNNGRGGAPNHRYTTRLAVRSQMLAIGYVAEGKGPLGIVMCAPSPE